MESFNDSIIEEVIIKVLRISKKEWEKVDDFIFVEDSYSDKLFLFKGMVQSGKSKFMTDFSTRLLDHNICSAILFRQNGDLIQFRERISNINNRIEIEETKEGEEKDEEKYEDTGGAMIETETEMEIKESRPNAGDRTGDRKGIRLYTVDDLKDELILPAIFLLNGNNVQMDKFRFFYEKNKEYFQFPPALFIDEADYIDSESFGTKKKDSLQELKDSSLFIAEISATILDIAAREDVKKENLYILEKPSSYRGIPSFTFVRTPEFSKFSSRKEDNIFILDNGLDTVVKNFIEEEPIWCPVWSDYHPLIMLINNGRTIDPQKRMMVDIINKYEGEDESESKIENIISIDKNTKEVKGIRKRLTLIIYIGDGLYIYNRSLTGDVPINVFGKESKITKGGRFHLIDGISPSLMLLWLKRNGGVNKFSHIIISSGDLAGRSISYGCKDDSTEKGLPYWHLTHHRLVLPKDSPCPAVEQKCRLCTIFETPVPLKLFVSREDEEAVIKSYWLQEELLDRGKNSTEYSYLRYIMKKLPIRSCKIPKGRTATLCRKLKPFKRIGKNGDDGGYDISVYGLETDEIDRERERGEERKDRGPLSEERLVVLDRINKNTIMFSMYEYMIEAYKELDGGRGLWISRSLVMDWIENNKDKCPKAKDLYQIAGHLRSIYQNKTIDYDDNSPGLIMLKDGRQDSDGNISIKYIDRVME